VVGLLFYLGLGALLTLEEAGVFLLPGDVSLVAAGLGAARGGSVLLLSWMVASLAMVTGASILFVAIKRHRASGRVMPRRVIRLIRRHGMWGVGAARLVPGLRNATVFAAASARMPYPRFLAGLVPAALLWSGTLLLLGYFGGATMLSTIGLIHGSPLLQAASAGLLVAAVVFVIWRLRAERRPQPVRDA